MSEEPKIDTPAKAERDALAAENAALRGALGHARDRLRWIADMWASEAEWPGGSDEEASSYASHARAGLDASEVTTPPSAADVGALVDGEGAKFLLVKRGLYWRPSGAGYTGIKAEAGRYDRKEAEAEARVHSDGEPVTMVSEIDAPPYSPACPLDVRLNHRAEAAEAARDALAAGVGGLLAAAKRVTAIQDVYGTTGDDVGEALELGYALADLKAAIARAEG